MDSNLSESLKTLDTLDVTERTRLMRDGLINNVSLLISGIVGIVLVPLMLKGLGAGYYGLWVVAMTVAGLVGMFDFGLFATVVREVSSCQHGEMSEETCVFVEGAANGYLLLGLTEALLLGTLGFLLAGRLQLDSQVQTVVPTVFWLVGIAVLCDQLNALCAAVLVGLRRFDYSNWIASGAVLFRAGGIILLLALGSSVVSIAIWHAIISAINAIVALFVIVHLLPQLHFRVGRLHSERLRDKISFALSSMITFALGNLTWQSGSLLIGFIQGSARVVPFYVGQKFPLAYASVSWQVAETLFPAASKHQRDLPRTRDLLRVGTRWVLVLALPVCILLWVVGPTLLSVWIGHVDGESLNVLRLISVAVLADAFMSAPLNVLWGRGAMRKVVLTSAGVAGGTVCLSLILLPRIGVTGAAWGTLLPMVAGSGAMFFLACQECQASCVRLAGPIFSGLLFPSAGCAVSAYLLSISITQSIWSLASACFIGSLVYVLGLYLATGEHQEKQFLQDALRQAISFLRLAN